jgi:serine/threonine-protein kinase RsbT
MRRGVGLVFVDTGPGIADTAQALRDGFTTGGGLGLGLGGSRRLVDEFEIDSRVGEGTAVSVVKWKR